MEVFIDNKYMTVSTDNGVLSLVWKDETTNLTDKSFKTEARKFIRVVKDQKCKNVLVDMRNFNYPLNEDIIAWRKEHIISVYNKLGIRKFAFISTKPAVNQDSTENTFLTRTFTSHDEATEWLTAE